MAGMARLALADGWRVCGPGWAPGNPEPEAWLTPEWADYLRLCASQPGRVAVSVHEYSLSDDIGAGWGWLVGRFRFVHEAADRLGAVSYTHLRAHETVLDLVCRLLLEKKISQRPIGENPNFYRFYAIPSDSLSYS